MKEEELPMPDHHERVMHESYQFQSRSIPWDVWEGLDDNA
jgi:hypothetical protein